MTKKRLVVTLTLVLGALGLGLYSFNLSVLSGGGSGVEQTVGEEKSVIPMKYHPPEIDGGQGFGIEVSFPGMRAIARSDIGNPAKETMGIFKFSKDSRYAQGYQDPTLHACEPGQKTSQCRMGFSDDRFEYKLVYRGLNQNEARAKFESEAYRKKVVELLNSFVK